MNSRLASIIRKEFVQIFRDRRTLALILVIPIMQLFLLGYAATNDVRNVPLAVFDQSYSTEARALLETYAIERQQRVRAEHAALKAAGKARTFMDIARENPVRFVLYLALAGAVAWFALVPFITLRNP